MTDIYNLFKFLEDKKGREIPIKAKLKFKPEELTPEDIEKMSGYDISWALQRHPQVLDKLPIEELDGYYISRVLVFQPQLVDKLPIEDMDGSDISWVLQWQPQLKPYFKDFVNETIHNNLIKEDFDTEINHLKNYGYKLIDKRVINKYILFLVKEPHKGLYEIGITSNNRDFTTPQSQEKIPGVGGGDEFSTAKEFKKTIKDWLNKYSPIYVGSLNKNKTLKYYNILSRLGFNVGRIEHNNSIFVDGNEVFPESWNFIIK